MRGTRSRGEFYMNFKGKLPETADSLFTRELFDGKPQIVRNRHVGMQRTAWKLF